MAENDSAHDRIAEQARTQLSAAKMASDDAATVEAVVRRLVGEYQDRAHAGLPGHRPLVRPEETIRDITNEITGHGDLEALLGEDGLEDVIIEGASVTAVGGGRVRPRCPGTTEEANRRTIERLIAPTGHALTATTPTLDGVQVDLGGPGHDAGDHTGCRIGRLAAAIPPCSPHLSADIRVFGSRHGDLGEMVDEGTLSPAAANFLTLVMWSLGSILIGGATGSRKSTLLVALLRRCRAGHLMRLVEESWELAINPQYGGRYQTTRDGEGSRTLSDLIRQMLRMRADLIVVGEVRGKECWDLAQAASSGAGWLATIHSRSAEASLDRLILLSLLAGENVSRSLVRDLFADSLDVVVHAERSTEGDEYLAQVTEIRTIEPSLVEGRFSSVPIFARERLGEPMEWTGAFPTDRLVERLERLLEPYEMTFKELLVSKELLV